jgi:hypothetical protein
MAERPWQEIIQAQVAQSRVRDRAPRRSTALNYPQELYGLVLAAARERDMSMTAYSRRAVLAFAHHDVGFDWAKELAEEPAVASFSDPALRRELNGLGCGYWRIVQLGEFS